MILRYWSVPVLDESRIELPGPSPAQRRVQTTTFFDLRDRRHHAFEIHFLRPDPILKMFPAALLFFIGFCIATFIVPAGIMAITKDESLAWIFGVWAIVALIVAVLMAKENYKKKKMMSFALAERGAPVRKVHLVSEKDWDRWAARLR